MAAPLIQSVLRALDVLESVSASGSGLTLAELSDNLGLKSPTAFNVAKTLVARGYLEKTSRPVRYRLGPSLQLLSERRRRTHWLQSAEWISRRLFNDLSEATVLVAENMRGDFVPRLRIDPLRPAVLEHVVNRHLSPYSAAVALCFQAFWSADERAAFRQRYPFSEYGQGVWSSAAELESFLHECRTRGYVLVRTSTPIRTAAPAFGSHGELLGCIGASLSRRQAAAVSESRIDHLFRHVCRAAQALSSAAASAVQHRPVPERPPKENPL